MKERDHRIRSITVFTTIHRCSKNPRWPTLNRDENLAAMKRKLFFWGGLAMSAITLLTLMADGSTIRKSQRSFRDPSRASLLISWTRLHFSTLGPETNEDRLWVRIASSVLDFRRKARSMELGTLEAMRTQNFPRTDCQRGAPNMDHAIFTGLTIWCPRCKDLRPFLQVPNAARLLEVDRPLSIATSKRAASTPSSPQPSETIAYAAAVC